MKFVANHLVAIHNAAAAEAMVLAMKAGLDPRQTVEVISSGAGTSRVFELRAPMMAARTYLPATARGTMFEKDIAVIGDFAADLRCPTPVFDLAASMHDGGARHGPRRGGCRGHLRGLRANGGAGSGVRRQTLWV